MRIPEVVPSKPIVDMTGKMTKPFAYFINVLTSLLENCDSDTVSLADDAETSLDAGATGWGFAQIGDNQEYALFAFTSAAVVTLVANSANAVNTDTDAKFCIYDGGTTVNIKNRLGSTLRVRYVVKYNPI